METTLVVMGAMLAALVASQALLWNAIRGLTKEIAGISERVARLEVRLDGVETQMTRLEARFDERFREREAQA